MTAEANETLRRLKVLQAPLKKERPSLSKWNLTASYHLQHGAYNLGWSRRLVHLPGLVSRTRMTCDKAKPPGVSFGTLVETAGREGSCLYSVLCARGEDLEGGAFYA